MSLEKFEWEANRIRQVEVSRFRTLVTEFEGGKTQTRSKTKLPRRWVLDFEKQNMTKDEANEIREFFEDHRGRHLPFLFDYKKDDGTVEENITVKFDTDTLDRQEEESTIYRFRIPIVEVL